MEEHNKKTLIEALSSLPEYEPEELLWEQIDEEMQGGLEGIVTPQLLQALPQHEPPASVWLGVARALGSGQRSAKILRFDDWKKPLAIAASLALLVVAYLQITRPTTLGMNVVAVKHSEEVVDPLLLQNDWDEDEVAFSEFLSLCEAKKVLCEQPEFKQLQGELEELTAAKEELKAAIGEFSTDAGLVLQIKEIELERTDILKKMMVMLI